MGKKTKNLNHLIWLLLLPHQVIANFPLEFPIERIQKLKKKIYTGRLQKMIESHSVSTAFTASTVSGTTNPCHLIRERLESHLPSNHCQGLGTQPQPNQRQGSRSHPATNAFGSFINASNIPNVIRSPTKLPVTVNSLWR